MKMLDKPDNIPEFSDYSFIIVDIAIINPIWIGKVKDILSSISGFFSSMVIDFKVS